MNSTQQLRIFGIFVCLTFLLFIAGCASSGGSNSVRQMDAALQVMGTCLDVTPQGNKAQCANQLYARVNSGLSDSDPDKAPSLKLITRMHSLLTRFDRNEISASEVQNGARQFANELKIDVQRARYYSAAQNEMESRRIRQLFQEAARLASPTNSNLKTCRPAPGYSPGTMVCQ